MNFGDDRLPERFWNLATPCPMSGCWLWTGTTVVGGYGRFTIKQKKYLAHRVAFVYLRSPILDGLQLDHLCRTPICVNPLHMEPVSARTNTLRSSSFSANNARRTHCKRGHELSGENLIVFERSPGHFMRKCRTCSAGIWNKRPRRAA